MFCESYQQALKRVAASCDPLSPVLERHVAQCAACRATLAEERELLGNIEAALSERVNTEAPPSLVVRVREAVLDGRSPSSLTYPKLLLWPVAVCLVALFVALFYERRPTTKEREPAVLSATTGTPAVPFRSADAPTSKPRRRVSRVKNKVHTEAHPSGAERRAENERSIEDLLRLARRRPDVVASFVNNVPLETPIEIQPIEVAELSWKPVVIAPTEETKSEPNR